MCTDGERVERQTAGPEASLNRPGRPRRLTAPVQPKIKAIAITAQSHGLKANA